MYLVGTFTMATILFVSTGIQFWLTDYFINVLKFPKEKVNIAYAIVSITGPTLGCAFGNLSIMQVELLSVKEVAMNIQPPSTLSFSFLQ
jgi:hypothetical protein